MSSKKILGAAALVAAMAGGGAVGALIGAPGLSGAQDAGSSSTTAPAAQTAPAAPDSGQATPQQGQTAPPQGQRGQRPPHDKTQGGHVGQNGTAETLLTGDTAAKVTAAAQAAVPGATIDRVENDAEGSPYEAHVTKADGTEATVKVDANFNVTTIEAGPPGR